MKQHKTSSSATMKFQVHTDATEVAISQVFIDVKLPYSDLDNEAIYGVEDLAMPECNSIEDFLTNINKSKLINVSLQNGKFVVQDTTGVLGESAQEIYKSTVTDKKIVLIKDGNSFSIRDFIDYSFTTRSNTVFFRGGSTIDYLGNSHLSGTTTNSRLLQTQSLVLGSDTATQTNRYTDSKTRGGLATSIRGRTSNGICSLDTNGRYRLPTLSTGDSVVLSVTGRNNGILMQSPFFGFVDALHVNMDEDILKTCSTGFVVRANRLFENVHIEELQNIPDDIKSLKFLKTSEGKVEIFAVKKNDSEILCFRTPVIAATSHFVIAEFQQSFTQFEVPIFFKTKLLQNRNGAFVAAFKTPGSAAVNFDICSSPKFEISAVNNLLHVNGVGTTLTVASATTYLIAIEKNDDLLVELYEAGSTVTTFSQVAPSFTHVTALDGLISWKNEIELGPWAITPEILDTDKIIQVIRAELDGVELSSENLGAFTKSTGTFENFSATFKAGSLVKGATTYKRLPFKVSEQMQNILRIQNNEITEDVVGDQFAYETRVQALYIYSKGGIEGYNSGNLICVTENKKNKFTLDFHKLAEHEFELYYEILDSQSGFLLSHDSKVHNKWSVTLQAR